jgi:hypothetical protein
MIALVVVLIIVALLVAYDFMLLYTFYAFNNTTSYFPWSWKVAYYDMASVQTMFNSVYRTVRSANR